MSAIVTKNFRGLHALVIHPEGANRDRLVTLLETLGMDVTAVEAASAADSAEVAYDLVLFDVDEGTGNIFGWNAQPQVPCIALIGNEAPSRLTRVVSQRAASHIVKPIRSAGVFTAVFLAVNEFQQRQRMQREMDALRQRLAGRRIITKAVLQIMQLCGVDDDEAYEWLRTEAMRRRVPIEDMARASLDLDKNAHETLQQARVSRNR